ncbi:hypothetical protein DPMN_181640 [Dreissena polymorpha]|uniref:Sushi domain-containing protein n=1 Tax=Dreissena polymorpha TaxID=45954 RepID=A0A9D4I4L4_DREPO|nr:hypothetical protein DPMN_181640 [Dreissena polymorpha]
MLKNGLLFCLLIYLQWFLSSDCPALNVSSETNKSNQGAVFEEDVELSCPTGHKFHLEKYSENRSLTLTCGKDQQWYIKEEKLVAIPECRGMSSFAEKQNIHWEY